MNRDNFVKHKLLRIGIARASRAAWLVALYLAASNAPSEVWGATVPKDGVDLLPRTATGEVAGYSVGNRVYSGDVVYYTSEIEPRAVVPRRWPNGRIVFEFEATVPAANRTLFRDACNAWASTTPVTCVERTSERTYVRVIEHDGSGCGGHEWVSCAPIGYDENTPVRDVEIFNGHWQNAYILRHEIGHVIGLIHEQQRQDRESFVQIVHANISPGQSGQFAPIPAEHLLDYDYLSIMHYDNCAFSVFDQCNPDSQQDESKWTIVPRPCGIPDRVGGTQITELDRESVRRAYAPQLFSAYPMSRRESCGIHQYSKDQVTGACGNSCSEASTVTYKRMEEIYDYDCGAFTVDQPVSFYAAYCSPIKKEYMRHWTDTDPFSCNLTTRFEWWIQCGCSTQSLLASCNDYSAKPSLEYLGAMIGSDNPAEQVLGRAFAKMVGWEERGNLSLNAFEPLTNAVFSRAGEEGFARSVGELSATTRLFMAMQLLRDPHYRLPTETFVSFARRAGVLDR